MKKPGLDPEHFEQQFPHQEKYYDTGKPVTPWWELQPKGSGAHGAYAAGGPVIDRAIGIAKKATEK